LLRSHDRYPVNNAGMKVVGNKQTRSDPGGIFFIT